MESGGEGFRVGERGGGGFEMEGGRGGRGGGVDTGAGAHRGDWEDFTKGGGGFGRQGRIGGLEEGREGGGDGRTEAVGGVDGVSRDPVPGLAWLVALQTTPASIVFPQTGCWAVLCQCLCSIQGPACPLPPPLLLPAAGSEHGEVRERQRGKSASLSALPSTS